MQWCHWWHHQYHMIGNMLMSHMCQKLICTLNTIYKPHIQLLHVHISDNYISKCLLNSLQSTMWPGTLVYIHFMFSICPWINMAATLLLYVPLTATVVYMLTPYYCIYKSKERKKTLQSLNHHAIAISVPSINIALKCQNNVIYAN